jgi:hypothetical protein
MTKPARNKLQQYHFVRFAGRYNIRVAGSRQHDDPPRNRDPRAVYTSETIGLIVIAVLLLVVILARYWHHLHWSLR